MNDDHQRPTPGRTTALVTGSMIVATVGVIGSLAAVLLRGLAVGTRADVVFVLYARHELPFFLLLTGFALLAWVGALRHDAGESAGSVTIGRFALREPGVLGTRSLAIAAVSFAAAAWLGSRVVLHGFPLSMDEYNSVFQAQLLAAGQLVGSVPSEWQRFAPALTPMFVSYRADDGFWVSTYLPGYAAIRALFLVAGIEPLTNPVLGGLSLVAIGVVSRLVWPSHPRRVWLAVLLLATSSQFLLMSMSWYSMPAHLLLNLIWLALYLRGSRANMAVVPFVGVLAMALHNPIPHILFVAPFAVRMLRERRGKRLLYFGVIYMLGAIACLAWFRFVFAPGGGSAAGSAGVSSPFAIPSARQIVSYALHLSLVLSWQSPAVALFIVVVVSRWRALGTVERDLAVGVLATVVLYLCYPFAQGHGWGYRYIYNVLGNLILLAAVGADVVVRDLGERYTRRIVAASVALTVLVQWPLRLVQIERFVRPFALASAYLQSRPEEAVVIESDSAFYAHDLIRNDPLFSAGPRILGAPQLTPADQVELKRRRDGRVLFVSAADLADLGLLIDSASTPARP